MIEKASAAGGQLGFVELTTREGSTIWVVAGAIWAIEKSPNEDFTLVKTASETLYAMETPQVVMERMIEVFSGIVGGGDPVRACPLCEEELPDDNDEVLAHYDQFHANQEWDPNSLLQRGEHDA